MNIRFRNIGLALIGAVAAVGLWSCSDDDVASPATEETDLREVSISLSSELSPTASDMTRAASASDDLYAIAISYARFSRDEARDNAIAYGVFDGDHLDNIKVTLDANTPYNIYATKVTNAKNVLETLVDEYYGEVYDDEYSAPFDIEKDSINKFRYQDLYSEEIFNGFVITRYTKDDNEIRYIPQYDRYYGELTNYMPSTDGDISIYLRRMTFGLTFNVTNLAEGDTLVIASYPTYFANNEEWSLKPITLVGDATGKTTFSTLYTVCNNLGNFYDQIVADTEPTASYRFYLKLTNADGTVNTDVSSDTQYTMDFQRLKAYTVNIDIPKYETKSATVTLEETEFTDENYTLDSTGLTNQSASSGE